jgi:hypothetical protein
MAPRTRAPVAAPGRVSALVEDGRDQKEAQHHQHQRGVVERLADPAAYAVLEEQPDVQRHQRPEDGPHDDRREQRMQDPRDRVNGPLGHELDAKTEGQEKIRPVYGYRSGVGLVERGDPQGGQLLLDQESDVVGAHAAPAAPADLLSHLPQIPAAVAELRDPVQERRQLHEPVGRVDEGGSFSPEPAYGPSSSMSGRGVGSSRERTPRIRPAKGGCVRLVASRTCPKPGGGGRVAASLPQLTGR